MQSELQEKLALGTCHVRKQFRHQCGLYHFVDTKTARPFVLPHCVCIIHFCWHISAAKRSACVSGTHTVVQRELASESYLCCICWRTQMLFCRFQPARATTNRADAVPGRPCPPQLLEDEGDALKDMKRCIEEFHDDRRFASIVCTCQRGCL